MSNLPKSSRTAKIAAAYRARASERPEPLCVDPWAQYLADDEARALLALGDDGAPGIELGVALRTAWLDDAVRSFEWKQVVLLGAGFDARAARLARPGLRFFEVDHPATQEKKYARIRTIASYPQHASILIPCDLERDDFTDALLAQGFSRDVPTLVIWEGVTAYLTEDAVRTTVRRVASILGEPSALLFDHLGIPAESHGRDDMSDTVRELDEPFLFLSNDVRQLVLEEGFSDVRSTSLESLRELKRHEAPSYPLYDRWYVVEARVSSPP